MNFDPIWFEVVIVLISQIAVVTPGVGGNVYDQGHRTRCAHNESLQRHISLSGGLGRSSGRIPGLPRPGGPAPFTVESMTIT